MKTFDVAAFALPNTAANEVRFEEPRDIQELIIHFRGAAPGRIRVDYLAKTWPRVSVDEMDDCDLRNPAHFGWVQIDDWFNASWQRASVRCTRTHAHRVSVTFRPVAKEQPDAAELPNAGALYRRTLGVRIAAAAGIRRIEIRTRSAPCESHLHVSLNAGRKTPTRRITLSGYNSSIGRISAATGLSATGKTVQLGRGKRQSFAVALQHMHPCFRYSGDDGLISFELDKDTFTISLTALQKQGPIWFADQGVFIKDANDPTTFEQYHARSRAARTVTRRVTELPEPDLRGTMRGQPIPHAVPFPFGLRHCREKFMLDGSGDLIIPGHPTWLIEGRGKALYKNDGDGRMAFGLENWIVVRRSYDPFPMLAYHATLRNGNLDLEQQAFACPIMHSVAKRDPAPDELLATLIRFRWTNTGTESAAVHLPLSYAAGLCGGRRCCWAPEGDPITSRSGWIRTDFQAERVIRASYQTTLSVSRVAGNKLVFEGTLAPGKSCELLLRVPYVGITTQTQKSRLQRLRFDDSYRQMSEWWGKQPMGSSIQTPEPRLNEVYRGHVPISGMADCGMADDPYVVNTSVGAGVYMNFTNEACMILEDLDERGLHEEARRRMAVWLKHQGTVGLMGNYSDHRGVFFGAGGGEQGHSYSQNHGWVLWRLAEHYFLTGDRKWFSGVADALVSGCDWVFRQCRHTRESLPHSRGWEYGFMPAGSLEDVDDYFYWLSTNCLTWRGVDTAARALAEIGHPQAARVQREANQFGRNLRRGYKISRQFSPLIRLRDGRWIPHTPSRLYSRGRDVGWIREVLEGSVYLLLSGLYGANSKEAQWILEDFQDTRYMNPPYGYFVGNQPVDYPDAFAEQEDVGTYWYHQAGFSYQPNLLAGLLPYLDRDEPEIYIWMFLNAWVSCYSEAVGSMFEHPIPILGHTNYAAAKTSDQSNSTKWLRYLFVYAPADTLYIGKAIPRAWFAGLKPFGIGDVSTRFGRVKVTYHPLNRAGELRANLRLRQRKAPARSVVRFRHPEKKQIRSVRINGKRHAAFNPRSGDVDITGLKGTLRITVTYRKH